MIVHTLTITLCLSLLSYVATIKTVGSILTLEHMHTRYISIQNWTCTHTPYAHTHTHCTLHYGYVNNYTNHTESPLRDGGTCTGLVVITPCHTQWLARHSDHRLSNSTTVYTQLWYGVAINDIHWYGIRGRSNVTVWYWPRSRSLSLSLSFAWKKKLLLY